MLRRIFLVWAVAILALWNAALFVPPINVIFRPRPLLAVQYVPMAFTKASGGTNTFTLIQHPYNNSCSGSTCSLTLTQAVGTGHLLILGMGSANVGVTLSGISAGGSYVHCSNCAQGNSTTYVIDGGYVLSSTSTAGPITITFSGSVGSMGTVELREYSFTLGATSLDTSGGSTTTTGSSPQAGVTLTLSGSKDVIFQMGVGTNPITAVSSPYSTDLDINDGFGFTDSVNTASGTAPTWTSAGSTNWGVAAMAFK